MLANYKSVYKIISDHKKELEDMKSCFGKLIMYNIIYTATNKRPSVATLTAKCMSKRSKYISIPLMELSFGGKNYNMTIDRIDKHITGEYETYEDVIKNKEGVPDDFEEQLEMFESIIIDNASSIFASLSPDIKKSNPEFNMISRSKRKRYLYYYKEHPKDSFGLVFLESQ